MRPCTNRDFPSHDYAGRQAVVVPCEMCGHTSQLHPGQDNPGLDACLVCQLLLLFPPRQDPAAPITPAGRRPYLAHIAIAADGTRMRAYVDDEPAAVDAAQRVGGVVVSLPVSTDCRENTPTDQ
jgi:hypothetical protein